jgi:predicted Zn-dependent peptidase
MKFNKKVLKNGLTILHEKRDLPVVSVAFAVRCGGVNESLEEKGISHFIEHMLYKGTPLRDARQIAEQIEKNGGELNGFTSEEITGYWCKMPSEKLEIALDVLSDMIKNPKFDEKEMEKERQVIFEEIKLYHDIPMRYVFEEVQKCLYGGTLSIDLAGTFETMNSINRNKMVERFGKVYKPNQMILCVVGDSNFEEIVDFAEKNFDEEEGEVSDYEITFKNEIKVEEREGIDQANVVFAYHVPKANEDKSFVARILSAVSAEGMSSRLFSEIREKRNLAYSVKGGSDIAKKFAHNFVYVGTMKKNVEKVKNLILEEFEKISKDLSEKELEEIKEQVIGHYKISMEESQTQLIELINSEIVTKAEDFYEFEKKVNEVKIEDVKEMASKVKEGNYSFFALVPKGDL